MHRIGAVAGRGCGGEFESVSRAGLRLADGARRKLKDGASRETDREPPWRHVPAELLDSVLAVKIDEVDGEFHAKGVNGLTGEDPQALSGSEATAPQQALVALGTAVGELHACGKHRVAGEVGNSQTDIVSLMMVNNEVIAQRRSNPVQQVHRGRLRFISAFRDRGLCELQLLLTS